MSVTPSTDELLTVVWRLLDAKDLHAVIAMLRQQPAVMAMDVYAKAQMELYWKRKDIPSLVAMSQAGIRQAQEAASANSAMAGSFLGRAKALAYNLASFTWPGWAEPGIVLATSDIAAGRDAAQLNLRLAEELNKPAKAKANALWLLGAHQLAQGDPASAIASFSEGESHAANTEEPGLTQMLRGYLALAHLLARPADPSARSELDQVLSALSNDPSEDAQEYARQLRTAHAVFRGTGF